MDGHGLVLHGKLLVVCNLNLVFKALDKSLGPLVLTPFEICSNLMGNPQYTLQDQGIFDSGCFRHMTGNKSFLTDYQEIDGGFVAFGEIPPVATSHPQKTQTPRQDKRGRDTEIPQSGGPPEKVGDEAVHKELGDRVERAATTAASLDAEQDNGNILKTQSTAIPNVPLSQGIGTGGSPRCQEAMGGTIAQTRSERVPIPSYDSPLLGGNTPESDEERIKPDDLTDFVPPTPP
ncbi:hypothetical protein Tco_0322726 [Tanacetum coccineum]